MILATKHHRTDDGAGDVGAMLDIDMSILGSAPEAYERYANEVMREWVPAVTSERRFRIGRIAFLRAVLASRRIYSTEEGVRRWEMPARRNVAEEIARLEARQGFVERIAARWVRGRQRRVLGGR
jgi:predicted metal-dependent HD superfamily phosphohydrolase